MRIACTYENGEIFQHFGHSEAFKVYDIEDGKVVSSAVIGTDGQGHGALAGVLAQKQVDLIICGGIGGGAIQALGAMGIQVFAGVSGSADAAVEALLKGELVQNSEANCHHHEGGCGGHGEEGGHCCGHCHH